MEKRVVIRLNLAQRHEWHDVDIPLDLNASELLEGLNAAYKLGLSADAVADCYVKAENPVVLMHGKKTLGQYGIMDGSIINITE